MHHTTATDFLWVEWLDLIWVTKGHLCSTDGDHNFTEVYAIYSWSYGGIVQSMCVVFCMYNKFMARTISIYHQPSNHQVVRTHPWSFKNSAVLEKGQIDVLPRQLVIRKQSSETAQDISSGQIAQHGISPIPCPGFSSEGIVRNLILDNDPWEARTSSGNRCKNSSSWHWLTIVYI